MKIAIYAGLGLSLLAGPALAQKMGMSNQRAPKIEQSIEIGDVTMELSYTAISYGQGQWTQALKDPSRREAFKTRINQTADSAPMGEFSCDSDCTIGGVAVPEGDYKLAFKLNDQYQWQLVLTGDDGAVTVPLELSEEAGHTSKRLIASLYAGDEDGTAGLYIAFGDLHGMLTIKPAAGSDDDEDDDDDGDG